LSNELKEDFKGSYINLSEFKGAENQSPKTLEAIKNPKCEWFYRTYASDFKKISGSPIAYWPSDTTRNIFSLQPPLESEFKLCVGLQTSDNERFMRSWHEVEYNNTGFNLENNFEAKGSHKKWFPFNKGGDYRKWFGNNEYVVNWEKDGYEVKNFKNEKGKLLSRPQNVNQYFKSGVVWGAISSSNLAVRKDPVGFIRRKLYGLKEPKRR